MVIRGRRTDISYCDAANKNEKAKVYKKCIYFGIVEYSRNIILAMGESASKKKLRI
jgi:hypothetical protein